MLVPGAVESKTRPPFFTCPCLAGMAHSQFALPFRIKIPAIFALVLQYCA